MMKLVDVWWHKWLKQPYRLACPIDQGAGGSVVLLHGIAAEGAIWHRLAELLSGKPYRVLAPDLLGFGASPKPDWPQYSVDDHSRAVLALLKRRRLGPPYIIVGHSMGCLIAAHIARQRPADVKRLILYEPPLFANLPEFRSHSRRRTMYFTAYGWLAKRPQLIASYGHTLGRIAARLTAAATGQGSWLPFERSLRNSIMQQSAYRDLHQVQVPTAVIHGRLDMIVTRAELKKMFGKNSHISFKTIPTRHNVGPRASRYLAGVISS